MLPIGKKMHGNAKSTKERNEHHKGFFFTSFTKSDVKDLKTSSGIRCIIYFHVVFIQNE